MKTYIVQQPITLGYGSHVRDPIPTRYKTFQPGSILSLASEAPNGNVWFFDDANERGRIECGEVANLVRDGRVLLADPPITRSCDHAPVSTRPCATKGTDSRMVTAGSACSRFLGEQDINAIVRGEVPIKPGDTFTAESIDCKGVSAYAYEPGCRQGRGEWNNFRLLYHGLRTEAVAAAISFANNRLSHPQLHLG